MRAAYYTYACADEAGIYAIRDQIHNLSFQSYIAGMARAHLVPVVFKKTKGAKAKGVDIQLTVDALALHDSLLREIEHTATHPSRMATLIREAAKVLPEPEGMQAEYKQMERHLVDIDRRIVRCQEAIETSTTALVPLVPIPPKARSCSARWRASIPIDGANI